MEQARSTPVWCGRPQRRTQRIEQAEANKLQNARWEILSEGHKNEWLRAAADAADLDVLDGNYATFFTIWQNAIPARNRVALDRQKLLFNALMGVRYVTVKAAAAGQETGTTGAAQAQTDAAEVKRQQGAPRTCRGHRGGRRRRRPVQVIDCENGYNRQESGRFAYRLRYRSSAQQKDLPTGRELPAREKGTDGSAHLTAAKTEVSLCLRSDLSGDERAAEAGLRPVTDQSSFDARDCVRSWIRTLGARDAFGHESDPAEAGGLRTGTTRVSGMRTTTGRRARC